MYNLFCFQLANNNVRMFFLSNEIVFWKTNMIWSTWTQRQNHLLVACTNKFPYQITKHYLELLSEGGMFRSYFSYWNFDGFEKYSKLAGSFFVWRFWANLPNLPKMFSAVFSLSHKRSVDRVGVNVSPKPRIHKVMFRLFPIPCISSSVLNVECWILESRPEKWNQPCTCKLG